MGKYTEWAKTLRQQMENAVENLIPDDKADDYQLFFMPYEIGKAYITGDKFRYNNVIYKVLQDHTSQEDWTPDTATSLYVQLILKDEYRVIPETITATEAFALGEKGWWNGVLYESLIEGNVYTPDTYPDGWKIVEE